MNAIRYRRVLLAYVSVVVLVCMWGCGGSDDANTDSPSDGKPGLSSTNPPGVGAEVSPDIILEAVSEDDMAEMETHVFPDGTRFRYPAQTSVYRQSEVLALNRSSLFTYQTRIRQFPANGEDDPGAGWILERHDGLIAQEQLFQNGRQRGYVKRVATPMGRAVYFTYDVQTHNGTFQIPHYITIVGDRVYVIWAIEELPDCYPEPDYHLAQLVVTTLQPGPALEFDFVNDTPFLVGTYTGRDINRPHYTERPRFANAYSFHPDGRLYIGHTNRMIAQSSEDDLQLLLVPQVSDDDQVITGQWLAQGGELTLVFNNRVLVYPYQFLPNDRSHFIIPDISGHSGQPFTLWAQSTSKWFNPDYVMQEPPRDTTPTVPTVPHPMPSPDLSTEDTQLQGIPFGSEASESRGGGGDE